MYVPQCRKRGDAVHLFLPYYLQDISQREGDGGEGGSCVQKVRHLKRKEEWGGGVERERRRRKKAPVTKALGESTTNFAACLCHQHPVGTTDVQMMSCRKGIGREGGVIFSAGGQWTGGASV